MALFLGGKSKEAVSLGELDIDERELVQVLSFVRLVIGVGFLVLPRRLGRWWTGEEDISTTSRMALRSLGGRDVALAVGTLVALENDGNVRGWLEAGAVADASDAIGTLTNWGDLPGLRRLFGLASSVSAVALGLNLAQSFSED